MRKAAVLMMIAMIACRSRNIESQQNQFLAKGAIPSGTFSLAENCEMRGRIKHFFEQAQATWGFGMQGSRGFVKNFFERFPDPESLGDYFSLSAHDKRAFLFVMHMESLERPVKKWLFGKTEQRGPVADETLSSRVLQSTQLIIQTGYFTLPDIGAQKIVRTFTRTCDLFDSPELKKVHGLGSTSIGRLVIDKSPKNNYTGLLQQGAVVPIMIRFSIANPVASTGLLPAPIPLEFIPGIGVKLFVDGRRSENVVAMESLAGQPGDHNFFAKILSNDFSMHGPDEIEAMQTERNNGKLTREDVLKRYLKNPLSLAAMKKVSERFQEAIRISEVDDDPSSNPYLSTDSPYRAFDRSVRRLSWVSPEGKSVAKELRRWPKRLLFKPSSEVCAQTVQAGSLPGRPPNLHALTDDKSVCSSSRFPDFRVKLRNIASGTVVYDILAEDYSSEQEGLVTTPIGKIVLDFPPIDSAWGDQELFLQHDI